MMGYYLAVPCISAKQRDKMLAFMAEHFRSPDQFLGWVTTEYGWYDDSDWQSDKEGSAKTHYGGLGTWTRWIKEYKVEFSIYIRFLEAVRRV